jgi:MFS family permease
MDNAGAVLGPLLATVLVTSSLSIRSVFWIAVIPGAIATALVAIVREPPRAHPAEPSATPYRPGEPAPIPLRAPKRDGVLTPTLKAYLSILALFSLGNSSDAFLLLRARSIGLTTAQIPVLWSVLNLSKVVWAYLGGDLADRIPRPRLIAGGWMVYAFVYSGLGHATAVWHVWALFVVYGIFYGLTEPVEKALLKDLVRADQRGRAYGAYNFVVGITALPAGVLAGALWRMWGPAVALEVGALFAGVAGALLLLWEAWRSRGRGAAAGR